MSLLRFALPAFGLVIGCRGAAPPGPVSVEPMLRGTVHLGEFFARSLGVRKRYLIYLPPSYSRESRRRYPVLYVLHGATGNEADWVSRGDLHRVADSVFAHGLPQLILVMPDGDNSFWVNWAVSPGVDLCARNLELTEAASSFCVPASRYGDYLAQDVVRHVDSGYRTLGARTPGGWALLCASILETQLAAIERRPDLRGRLERLDSLVRGSSGMSWLQAAANLTAARYWEELGEPQRALTATRRRLYITDLGVPRVLVAQSTLLREEGRLAAKTGDREGAIRAYRKYLALRAAAEPAPAGQVGRVKAALDSLERAVRRN